MEIEVEDGECGATGLFLSHEDGETTLITGITARHVLKRKPHGRAIYQPTNIEGFLKEYTILTDTIQELKAGAEESRSQTDPPTHNCKPRS